MARVGEDERLFSEFRIAVWTALALLPRSLPASQSVKISNPRSQWEWSSDIKICLQRNCPLCVIGPAPSSPMFHSAVHTLLSASRHKASAAWGFFGMAQFLHPRRNWIATTTSCKECVLQQQTADCHYGGPESTNTSEGPRAVEVSVRKPLRNSQVALHSEPQAARYRPNQLPMECVGVSDPLQTKCPFRETWQTCQKRCP